MTRLILLGFLAMGLAGFAIGQNSQGGNGQGGNNNNQGQSVPEPSQIIGALVVLGGSALAIRVRRNK